jgi:outer membrane PBP1 activator LpoA protein
MSTETIPLKIGKIRAQLQQAWPDAARKNGVFYAMGVDAYFLLERLSMLQSMPHFSYFGETGVLTIDPNQRIYPRLLWLKLIGGKPELLNHG